MLAESVHDFEPLLVRQYVHHLLHSRRIFGQLTNNRVELRRGQIVDQGGQGFWGMSESTWTPMRPFSSPSILTVPTFCAFSATTASW